MSNGQKLFTEFSAVVSKQWKQQLQFELKGEDYNNVLVWNSPEDIKVKPFYHFDENVANYGAITKASKFKIVQNIFVHDVSKSILRTNDVLSRGADVIRYSIDNQEIDIEKLLSNPSMHGKQLYFNLNFLSEDFVKKTEKLKSKVGFDFFLNIDPIGHLSAEGNWFSSNDRDTFKAVALLSNNNPTLSINISLFQNAGANIVQQLAFGMAHATEYLNSIQNAHKMFVFEVAVGSNYFFEIAKLRALRLLFQSIASEFGKDYQCHILATPSKRNKTIYDYNTNMLRTTAECTAAILGGADAIMNLPYDALYHKDNEFGDRIARNQLLILKHEAYLNQVDNPADGCYYIESLTQQLAEKALVLFKEIENAGGFIHQLKEGVIQSKIQESANKEQALFDSGKEILLGTNKHPNPKDSMKHDLELFPFLKFKPRKTIITPILEKRLAEKIEQERFKSEL